MEIMSRGIAGGQLLKNKIKTDGRRCNAMNCSENTRTATQRAKQNLWFRRMFSVALLIGVLIGFLFAKVPIWFSTPEPTTTAVLYGAYTGQAVKVQVTSPL